MKKDSLQRSVFCTYPIPEDMIDKSPEDVCQWFCEQWHQEKATRQAMASYCVSAKGHHHVHAVFSADQPFRWSAVLKAVPVLGDVQATRGTKEQAIAYIRKEGDYAEKGEQVLCEKSLGGEIQSNQGRRSDLDTADEMIKGGLTPGQIYELFPRMRRYEKYIRSMYFDKRKKETPRYRDVKVVYHIGDPGSGKTRVYNDLCEKYGDDSVYLLNDYDHGFDMYFGEKYLCLDEFRGGFRYAFLLQILDKYKMQIPCRYQNSFMLWNEVHIFTVIPPELIYKNMVQENRDIDVYAQLARRINEIVYHWNEGTYDDPILHEYVMPFKMYRDYNDLKQRALGDKDGFVKVPDNEPSFGDI